MPCTVCQHPERQVIDQALLAKTTTLTALSQQHGLSLGALHRHKQHLLKKMSQAQNRFQEILRQGIIFKLNIFLELAMRTALTASDDGNFRLVLQAIREGTRIIKFMVKSDFPIDAETVYRLLDSPQWADQGCLLPTDPKIFAGSHQTLAGSLFSHCPEISPPFPDSKDDADGEYGGKKEYNDDKIEDTEEIPELRNHDSELRTPSQRWKKGGKKPKYSTGSALNNKQIKDVTVNTTKAGKTHPAPPLNPGGPGALPVHPCHNASCQPGAAPASKNHQFETQNSKPGTNRSWIQDLNEGRLDIDTLHAIGAGRIHSLDVFNDAVSPGGWQTIFLPKPETENRKLFIKSSQDETFGK